MDYDGPTRTVNVKITEDPQTLRLATRAATLEVRWLDTAFRGRGGAKKAELIRSGAVPKDSRARWSRREVRGPLRRGPRLPAAASGQFQGVSFDLRVQGFRI